MAAVATIGTLVGMAGVGHAMFDALAADGAAPWAAGLEAALAALFLEGVVMVCARRAREQAADSKAARLDVAVVLTAAVVSGLVSGIHAGLGSTAGLFRFAVPIIAAAVWLGDVVTVLRRHRSTDHERTLRAVLAAVGRHAEAKLSGRPSRVRRADVALVRAMSEYAAADGDRGELARRLNEVHHRTDLLTPLGPSPWPVALIGQSGHPHQPDQADQTDQTDQTTATSDQVTLTKTVTSSGTAGQPPTVASDQHRDQAGQHGGQDDQPSSDQPSRRVREGTKTSRLVRPASAPTATATSQVARTVTKPAARPTHGISSRNGDQTPRPVTSSADQDRSMVSSPGHADQAAGRVITVTSAVAAPLTSDQDADQSRGQRDQGGQWRDQGGQWRDQPGHRDWSRVLEKEPDEVCRLVTELANGRTLSAASAAQLLGVSQSTGGRRLRRARALVEQSRQPAPVDGAGPIHLSLVNDAR